MAVCCIQHTFSLHHPRKGVNVTARRISVLLALTALAALGATAAALAARTGSTADTPKRGGSITIARIEDSQSFDKTNVFQNESIWLTEQINEPLYLAGNDGKTLKPWLATSYTQSKDGLTYTFTLRKGVKFSNGKPMTSADVKFSIDDARAQSKGWGYLDAAIKSITAPNPGTVVFHLKYKWAPFLADVGLFANGIIPNKFGGESRTAFYKHPVGTGPFMWDKRVVGQSVTFKRNPYYWQKGKPYLDSVTWKFVTDENTRELQLRGNQIQIDEFPPFNSISKLQKTSGVKMYLFPSTRTDYLDMNEKYPPLKDVHVRRAISLAIDRKAIIKSVLFTHGTPANSFLPPQVPFYDPESPGLQFDLAKAKAEMAKSKFKKGFKVTLLVGAGAQVENTTGQIIQSELKPLGIDVTFKQEDTSTEFNDIGKQKYQLAFSYWTMDIADPDELVTFAIDPAGGAHSFYTDYNNPQVVALSHKAQRETDPAKRTALYSQLQKLAANDAFLGFLYYSPFRWATTDKVHGFFVQPLGNYHLEDVWLG
jgi:peptide/nickel transport system substrate-binding protein